MVRDRVSRLPGVHHGRANSPVGSRDGGLVNIPFNSSLVVLSIALFGVVSMSPRVNAGGLLYRVRRRPGDTGGGPGGTKVTATPPNEY